MFERPTAHECKSTVEMGPPAGKEEHEQLVHWIVLLENEGGRMGVVGDVLSEALAPLGSGPEIYTTSNAYSENTVITNLNWPVSLFLLRVSPLFPLVAPRVFTLVPKPFSFACSNVTSPC